MNGSNSLWARVLYIKYDVLDAYIIQYVIEGLSKIVESDLSIGLWEEDAWISNTPLSK